MTTIHADSVDRAFEQVALLVLESSSTLQRGGYPSPSARNRRCGVATEPQCKRKERIGDFQYRIDRRRATGSSSSACVIGHGNYTIGAPAAREHHCMLG